MIKRWMIPMVGGAATFIAGLLGGLSAESAGNPWGLCIIMTGMLGLFAIGLGFVDSLESW